MSTPMAAPMYTLLLVDGCHYIDADDAARIAVAVREGHESIDVVAHITAMHGTTRTARVSPKDVLKLIAHDVRGYDSPAEAVSLSAARAKRRGRSASTIPFSVR